jgi:zinc transporter ZupT
MDDKAQHRLAGFCIAIIVAAVVAIFWPAIVAGALGLLSATVAGALKEWVFDAADPIAHTVDRRDFWATVQGGTLGSIVFLVIQDLTERFTCTL